jgi:flavorubredoxin
MVEDRLRGLKLRVPVKGVRARLIPTFEELGECRALGRELALHLTGRQESTVIDMAALA